MKGSLWTILSFAVTKLAVFVTTAVLARLLTPEDFGTLALVSAYVTALMVVSDLGLAGILVIRAGSEKRLEQITFGAYLLIAAGGAALVGTAAIVCAAVGRGSTAALLAGMAALTVLSGPSWFFGTFLRTHLRFRPFFAVQASTAIVQLVVAVLLAFAGFGVWAMIAGQCVGLLAGLLVVPWACGPAGFPRPRFAPAEMRAAVKEGRGFLAQSFFGYASQNADNLVLAIVSGRSALGVYSLGYKIAETSFQALVNPVSQVTFVRFARLRKEGDPVEPAFLRSFRLLCLPGTTFAAVLVSAPASVVTVLYGPNWSMAHLPLALLGVWAFVRVPQSSIGYLLNAMGYAGIMAKYAGVLLAISAVLLTVGAWQGGPSGVALAMVVDIVISLVLLLGVIRTRLGWSLRPLVETIGMHLLSLVLAVVLVDLLRGALLLSPGIVDLANAVVVVGVVQLVALAGDRPLRRDLAAIVARLTRSAVGAER